jgi:hypothetical protein
MRPTREELEQIGVNPERFFAGESALNAPVRDENGAIVPPRAPDGRRPPPPGHVWGASPKGCEKCNGSGYGGRTGLYEVLSITEEIRRLAIRNADASEIKACAVEQGMRTLRDDGAYKVLCGMTTIEEVMRVTAEEA